MGTEGSRRREGAPTVGDLGERAIIAALTRAARDGSIDVGSAGPDLVIGSGDDAAVIDVAGPVVISTDTAVQGRHFRLDWSSPVEIGARAVVASAADIAAMGGRVTGIVASIACPTSTPVDIVLGIDQGIVEATHRLGARVLGGDLVGAEQIVLGVTVLGAMDGRSPVSLGGARAGDVLAVSGPLGGSAAGLAALLAHDADVTGSDVTGSDEPWSPPAGLAPVVAAFRTPSPDLRRGIEAAEAGVHAMTDISDGLVEELVTMAQACGLLLTVESSAVPRAAGVVAAAAILGADDRRWALTGGEDHQLLAAFDRAAVPAGWSVIGDVQARTADADVAVLVDGVAPSSLTGWQSFGPAAG